MSTMIRKRRVSRYTRRAFRSATRFEAFAESLMNDVRRIADAPLEGLPLAVMSFSLGAFLAALFISALLGA